MPLRILQEGADEKGNSSSPFCARSCTTPSLDASIGHATAFPPRRCRRKRQFIGTFLCPQLYDPVPKCLYRPRHRISPKKVPTKMMFNRLFWKSQLKPLFAVNPPCTPSEGVRDAHHCCGYPESHFNEFTSGCTLNFN